MYYGEKKHKHTGKTCKLGCSSDYPKVYVINLVVMETNHYLKFINYTLLPLKN